jgi:hypothetical protein
MGARNLEVDYTSATNSSTKYRWTCGGIEEKKKKNIEEEENKTSVSYL